MSNELREKVVQIGKSREKKNQYTQGAKRTQVGSGWSDCSSFVRWCYLQVLNKDIGSNTAAQVNNKKLEVIDTSKTNYPDEKKLLPGDLLYFKGTDKSRPYMVGHVEMYAGNGQLIGHGSGVGPRIKAMKTYCNDRAKNNRNYIRTLRVIPADGETGAVEVPTTDAIVPANPLKATPTTQPEHGIKITGSAVNLRTGPGTTYDIVRTASKGQVYAIVDATGWRSILVDGEVCWVSEKLSEEV